MTTSNTKRLENPKNVVLMKMMHLVHHANGAYASQIYGWEKNNRNMTNFQTGFSKDEKKCATTTIFQQGTEGQSSTSEV